eukprot:s713_g15.t1
MGGSCCCGRVKEDWPEVESNSPPPIFRDVRNSKDVHFLIQKPSPEEASPGEHSGEPEEEPGKGPKAAMTALMTEVKACAAEVARWPLHAGGSGGELFLWADVADGEADFAGDVFCCLQTSAASAHSIISEGWRSTGMATAALMGAGRPVEDVAVQQVRTSSSSSQLPYPCVLVEDID